VVELSRGDDLRHYLARDVALIGDLSTSQGISLAVFPFALLWLVSRLKTRSEPEEPAGSA